MATVDFKTLRGDKKAWEEALTKVRPQSAPQRPMSLQAVPPGPQHTQRLAGPAGEVWMPETHKARLTADPAPCPTPGSGCRRTPDDPWVSPNSRPVWEPPPSPWAQSAGPQMLLASIWRLCCLSAPHPPQSALLTCCLLGFSWKLSAAACRSELSQRPLT